MYCISNILNWFFNIIFFLLINYIILWYIVFNDIQSKKKIKKIKYYKYNLIRLSLLLKINNIKCNITNKKSYSFINEFYSLKKIINNYLLINLINRTKLIWKTLLKSFLILNNFNSCFLLTSKNFNIIFKKKKNIDKNINFNNISKKKRVIWIIELNYKIINFFYLNIIYIFIKIKNFKFIFICNFIFLLFLTITSLISLFLKKINKILYLLNLYYLFITYVKNLLYWLFIIFISFLKHDKLISFDILSQDLNINLYIYQNLSYLINFLPKDYMEYMNILIFIYFYLISIYFIYIYVVKLILTKFISLTLYINNFLSWFNNNDHIWLLSDGLNNQNNIFDYLLWLI